MPAKQYVMGYFGDDDRVAQTVDALKRSGWRLHEVYGPHPSNAIAQALNPEPSKVGYFTLIGGILGFFIGFWLAVFTAGQWNLIVSGKPVVSLVPFFIVGFECTILFGIFGNVLGLLTQARLPRIRLPGHYDPRFTGEHFGLLASCDPAERDDLIALIQGSGGETKTIEDATDGESE